VKSNRIIQNTISLYAMNIAKLIIPLLTLPYLTRVLSKDVYGVVSYVKAVMQYMILFIEFGFLLSGTKDIVAAKSDQKKLCEETANILAAKLLLGAIAGGVLLVMTAIIPILRRNILFTLLSFVPIFLTCFLFEYVFRGLERMTVITVRFVVMKTIATALTFMFVKSDADIMLIPIFDTVGTLVACVFVFIEMYKLQFKILNIRLKTVFVKIKKSTVYFASDFATTAFGALNTLLIGIFITEADVANWSLCMQLVVAVQSMYSPIINGIYPEMVRSKNIRLVKKSLKLFVPVVLAGCVFTLVVAKYVLLIIGGEQYVVAAPLLRVLVPVMFFGLPSMMYGWPTLGAIDKAKETTIATIGAAVFQVLGLLILLAIGQFTIMNIAWVRSATECVLFVSRYYFYRKYRSLFSCS
jgi:PST family polysaccharide transporter